MAEGTIRINKVLKDFNIGLSTLAEFLKKKNVADEITLTSKISDEAYALVAKEFGKEQLIKEQSRKVAIKVKEITEKENVRQTAEEEEPVKEVIIKTNVFTEQKKVDTPAPEAAPETPAAPKKPEPAAPKQPEEEPAAPAQPAAELKVVGHIDLTPKKKPQPAAKAEPATKPEAPVAEEKPEEPKEEK